MPNQAEHQFVSLCCIGTEILAQKNQQWAILSNTKGQNNKESGNTHMIVYH